MKQMQKSSKTFAGAVLLRIRGVEHRSKSCLKTILHEEAKAASENDPKDAQDGPKIDPSWG